MVRSEHTLIPHQNTIAFHCIPAVFLKMVKENEV